ncbi:hypothetical protein KCV87_21465 [Actinosynnema pretiosum subsp. pretiosum]|uniref:Uncharacterized protein n=1 Tax=Actinosynnema pretiosum subsp. pretiosum TaxID=103721 RepID=A0AA45L2M0_9PSEU|nr:hypothetical protein KCV87_21465 [Actinosynnema pretiosum subsp. pretiosum]
MEEKSLLGVAALAGGAVGGAATAFFAANKRLGEIMDNASSAGAQEFRVSPETVLKAIRVISEQCDLLRKKNLYANQELLIAPGADTDPISASVIHAWNENLVLGDNSYATRIEQYASSLEGLANQLTAAAREYQITEEEINSALAGKSAS